MRQCCCEVQPIFCDRSAAVALGDASVVGLQIATTLLLLLLLMLLLALMVLLLCWPMLLFLLLLLSVLLLPLPLLLHVAAAVDGGFCCSLLWMAVLLASAFPEGKPKLDDLVAKTSTVYSTTAATTINTAKAPNSGFVYPLSGGMTVTTMATTTTTDQR